jgi:hypothetical protein
MRVARLRAVAIANAGASDDPVVKAVPLGSWLLKKPDWLDHQTAVALTFAVTIRLDRPGVGKPEEARPLPNASESP